MTSPRRLDVHADARGLVFEPLADPGVAHAVLATGDRTGVLVAFSDLLHDPDRPDTFRDPLFTDEELGRR